MFPNVVVGICNQRILPKMIYWHTLKIKIHLEFVILSSMVKVHVSTKQGWVGVYTILLNIMYMCTLLFCYTITFACSIRVCRYVWQRSQTDISYNVSTK